MVAPQRIDDGMQHLMTEDERVRANSSGWPTLHHLWLTTMRVCSDYASYQWQSKVVGYNTESQQSWMSKLGLNSVYSSIMLMVAGIVILALLYALSIYWKIRQAQSPLERSIQQLNQSLGQPLKQQSAETFRQWMLRLSKQADGTDPALFSDAIQIFEKQAYSGVQLDTQELSRFKDLLKTCASVLRAK